MNTPDWLTHGFFIAAAFGACALTMAAELWWLRVDMARAAAEALAAGDANSPPLRRAVLVDRTPLRRAVLVDRTPSATAGLPADAPAPSERGQGSGPAGPDAGQNAGKDHRA